MRVHEIFENLGEIASASEIYVDMDGVLADFFGEWARLMDVDHFTQINKQHDIDDALQKIRDTDDFWLRLPVLPQAKELLNLIKQVKGEYYICTSPLADDPNSERHKRTWVEENLAFFPPKEVYVTHNKPQYAKHEDGTPNILIDDYGVNINNWEAAGGIGFKYKDHKFERTAKAIKQHMQEPVEENSAGDSTTEEQYKNLINKYFKKGAGFKLQGGATYKMMWNELKAARRWLAQAVKAGEVEVGADVAQDLTIRDKDGLEIGLAGSMTIKAAAALDKARSMVKENFADGKEKGKSRPGRVKRSGASCNGSVTALRKRAKNASGEKAKMYHWCANMKSGRKK